MSKFNSDELVPPSFVNQQLVVEVLKAAEKDSEVKLISHEIVPGSAAGDHYASIMFKIIATYESTGKTVEKRRFILKTMPDSGEKAEFLQDYPIFTSEINMYSKTLPAMEQILEKHGEKRWWPTMVYATLEPKVIVFDDVTQQGFTTKHEPLSFDKLQPIVEKIAKFHALSMVLAADPDKQDVVTQYMPVFEAEKLRPLYDPTIKQSGSLAKAVESWPGMEEIGRKLGGSLEKMYLNYMACYQKIDKLDFTSVLNHGDFHIRNLMFSEDDVLFLDFQMPSYRAPAFDLVYMLNAMGDKEVRDRRNDFLKLYHRNLVQCLKRFGFQGLVPSLIDIHTEVLNLAPFEAFQLLTFLPISRVDLTGVELGDMFGKDKEHPLAKVLEKVYQEPEFIEDLKRSLVYFDALGIFD